jgi:hypothetical protein
VTWEVEYTDEFGAWWEELDEDTQIAIDATVRLLETKGPHLPFPHSSDVRGSRFGQMRELRVQHKGEPYRVLYAFDPRRTAILLIGGNKGGNNRWYQEYVPRADKLYKEHLAMLVKEGLIHGKKV